MKYDGDVSLFPLFVGLRDEEIDKLNSMAVEKEYKKGDFIFLEGQEGTELHVILDGDVGILKSESDSKNKILNTLSEGECIGEMSMIDIEPRSASLMVLSEKAKTLVFDIYNLREFFADHKDAFIVILMNITRTISRRLRKLEKDIVSASDGEAFSEHTFSDNDKLISSIINGDLTTQMILYTKLKEKFSKFD